jgi:hypothetical protein
MEIDICKLLLIGEILLKIKKKFIKELVILYLQQAYFKEQVIKSEINS